MRSRSSPGISARQSSRGTFGLGEPEMCVDLPKAAAKLARRHPVGSRDPRNIVGRNADEQHGPVQHPVVLEVQLQGRRHVLGMGAEEDRGA